MVHITRKGIIEDKRSSRDGSVFFLYAVFSRKSYNNPVITSFHNLLKVIGTFFEYCETFHYYFVCSNCVVIVSYICFISS